MNATTQLISKELTTHWWNFAANSTNIDSSWMSGGFQFGFFWEDGVYQSRLPLVPFASVGWHLNTCVTGLGLCQLNLWLRFASFVGGSAAIDKVGKALGDARQYTTGEDQKRSTSVSLCVLNQMLRLCLYPSKCFWGYPTNFERNIIVVTDSCCTWAAIDFKW